MLALYIAMGAAAYLGIGLQCASKSIDTSIRKDYTKDRTASDACWAFFLWPMWFIDDGIDEIVLSISSGRKETKLLEAARQEEIDKIILEEEL